MSDQPSLPPTPPARESNTAALISMICGVLLCIPLLTSIPAIAFGVVGLRKARLRPQAGGRGLAIAGLVLGIIGLAGWIAAGIGGYMAYRVGKHVVHEIQAEVSQPGQAVVRSFIQDVAAGNVEQAADVTSPEIDPTKVKQLSVDLKQLGTLRGVTIDNVVPGQVNGIWQVKVSGTAQFANGNSVFSITVAKEPAGLRIVSYDFR